MLLICYFIKNQWNNTQFRMTLSLKTTTNPYFVAQQSLRPQNCRRKRCVTSKNVQNPQTNHIHTHFQARRQNVWHSVLIREDKYQHIRYNSSLEDCDSVWGLQNHRGEGILNTLCWTNRHLALARRRITHSAGNDWRNPTGIFSTTPQTSDILYRIPNIGAYMCLCGVCP